MPAVPGRIAFPFSCAALIGIIANAIHRTISIARSLFLYYFIAFQFSAVIVIVPLKLSRRVLYADCSNMKYSVISSSEAS